MVCSGILVVAAAAVGALLCWITLRICHRLASKF